MEDTKIKYRMEDEAEDTVTTEYDASEEAHRDLGGRDGTRQRNACIDAEEYKKVVASLLPAWKDEREEIYSLQSTWPRSSGFAAGLEASSVTEELVATRPCEGRVERVRKRPDDSIAKAAKRHKGHDAHLYQTVSDRGIDAHADYEYGLLLEAEEAMNIPSLPYPSIQGVSEDIIKTVIRSRKRCGACAMCVKDKGHRNFKCETLIAVVAWEKEMGAIDGALVFQIAQKLGQVTAGHGMRQGKGLRCGRCKTCSSEHPDKMCLTTVAVRDGKLPDRLKPAAMGVSLRKNTCRSVADPFSRKPSGFRMLQENCKASGTSDLDDEMGEYRRWGITNLPYGERIRVRDLVQQAKKKVKFQKNWKCLNLRSDGTMCGQNNREGVKVCHACKSLRWLGPEGQIESRVAAILDRGMLDPEKEMNIALELQKIILREHGNAAMLAEQNVSLEAIQDAVRTYQHAKDTFKVDLERRSVSLRLMHLQDIMDPDILEAGKVVKDSAFGEAVTRFDDSLIAYTRQRGARRLPEEVCAQHSTRPTEDLDTFVHDVLRGIEYILYSMYGFIDIEQKLASLKSCLLDWGSEPGWLDAMKMSWKCPLLRKQMSIIVYSSYMFTIKSMLAYFIHCVIKGRQGGFSAEKQTRCSACSVDHSVYVPSWRTSPVMVQMSDRIHDITPRVMDEGDFCLIKEEDRLLSLYRDIRYPLYRLVEATLNEAALHEASERVPVKQRPNPHSRFVESTKVSSFPALPVEAQTWYEKESMWLGETPEDDLIAKCIPDGKIDTNKVYTRILKKKNDKRCRKIKNIIKSTAKSSNIQSAFSSYGTSGSQSATIKNNTNEFSALVDPLPEEVQFVFRAAQQTNVLSTNVLEKSIQRYILVSRKYEVQVEERKT